MLRCWLPCFKNMTTTVTVCCPSECVGGVRWRCARSTVLITRCAVAVEQEFEALIDNLVPPGKLSRKQLSRLFSEVRVDMVMH